MSRISTDAVRQPLRELQNNRCFYCEKAIREAAEVDHFIPWARHPDNGIENLVVADQRCNHDKRDFLAAGDHVPRWKVERFERNTSGLAQIAERASWDRAETIALVAYARSPELPQHQVPAHKQVRRRVWGSFYFPLSRGSSVAIHSARCQASATATMLPFRS